MNNIYFTPILSTDEITLESEFEEDRTVNEWIKVLKDIVPPEVVLNAYRKRKQEKFIEDYYNRNIKKIS